MDDILDHGYHSCAIHHDDQPPLVVVNKIGFPRAALPTLLSFPHSHAFKDGGPTMIWDSHSSSLANPLQIKRNRPWGFALAPQLWKAFLKEPIGKFWGKLWISIVSHGFSIWTWHIKKNCPFTPTRSTPSFTCCTFCWVNYVNAKGGDVTIGQIHLWQLWDKECQGRFMGVE